MIELSDIEFGYPQSDFRLRVPTMEFAAGEQVALIGPSGCGKTTLLNLISGIEVPTGGYVQVGDTEVSKLTESARRAFRAAKIGLVFQSFALLDYLTVRENLQLPDLIGGAKLDASRASQLLELLNLQSLADRRADRLSQGERQRVAVARAVVHNPSVVLADEPTGNLDPSLKRQALELLQSAAREQQATLIVVTHDHSLLDQFERVVDFAELGVATA